MAKSTNDFKWFGEGFDGFPKLLPEDCIEYSIYIIDSKLKDSEVRGKLRSVQNAATKLTKNLLKDFIWQREPFKLTVERDADRSCLHGRTNFGDSTDDEWTIVYILRELSRQFPNLWIRVIDTDGEFLLIEAANVLPIWLNPEVADFRVWIHNGQLLTIPVEKPGGHRRNVDTQDGLKFDDAIAWIEDPGKSLQHSTKVENEAFARLRNYPQQIKDSLHQALVTLPRNLAYVLHQHPASVSLAIEAFYLRDPISLKPLQSKSATEYTFSPVDLVTTSVKFTKVGFAQLRSQQFLPPQAWTAPTKNVTSPRALGPMDIGMKVACGFEMLLSDKQNRDKQIVREANLLLEDLTSGDAHVPSDEDVGAWGLKEDDDSWLDINFEDFEKELAGKSDANRKATKSGFGDATAHSNLQRTVKRFEHFLEQEANLGSTDLIDDMDHDDDDSTSDEGSGTDDDLDADRNWAESNTNDDEFTAMMREMMGMPANVMKEIMHDPELKRIDKHQEIDPGALSSTGYGNQPPEEGSVLESMHQTEKELREAGVLDV